MQPHLSENDSPNPCSQSFFNMGTTGTELITVQPHLSENDSHSPIHCNQLSFHGDSHIPSTQSSCNQTYNTTPPFSYYPQLLSRHSDPQNFLSHSDPEQYSSQQSSQQYSRQYSSHSGPSVLNSWLHTSTPHTEPFKNLDNIYHVYDAMADISDIFDTPQQQHNSSQEIEQESSSESQIPSRKRPRPPTIPIDCCTVICIFAVLTLLFIFAVLILLFIFAVLTLLVKTFSRF